MEALLRCCGFVVGLWIAGSVAHAQPVDLGRGPVLLLADEVRYDQEEQVLIAAGNVEIVRGESRLFADLVRWDERADVVEARGNVILLEPRGEAIFAEEATLSGDFADGVVQQLRARLADNSLFAAAQARRFDGAVLEMDRAVYSPCRVCPGSGRAPLWQLSAERVVHDQAARSITYRNAFFELFGVPILYTPYFSHPDPSVERESGFLSPTVGSDSELGFTLQTPYYFALAPNYDLTLAPIFTGKEGVVLASEWRHLTPSGRYELAGSATYASAAIERRGEESRGEEVRGHITGDGRFLLGERWIGGFELAAASDDTYLQRYDFSDKDVLENRLFAERMWGRNYLGLNAYGFQDLREFGDQGETPIALPLAQADLVSDPMWWDSRFTLDANVLALTRTEGLDTRRLSFTGGWEVPWLGPIGDRYELRLSLRGDAYYTDGDPQTFTENGTGNEFRGFPRATLSWSWPLIGDTFGLAPLLEPVVMATWAPSGLNDEDIPNEDSLDLEFDDTNLFEPNPFPGLDRIADGANVAYGLRMGLFGERGEWLSGLFGQRHRFSGEDDVFDPDSGLEDPFSDYVGRVEFTPTDWFDTRYRFRLDQDSLTLLRNEVRAIVGPRRLRLDVTYLSLEDDPAAEEFRTREEVTAGVLVRPTSALALRAQTRRNLVNDESIAHNFGLIYRNPCLVLIAALERRFTRNRDAGGGTTFTLRITLQQLGEVVAESSMFGL